METVAILPPAWNFRQARSGIIEPTVDRLTFYATSPFQTGMFPFW